MGRSARHFRENCRGRVASVPGYTAVLESRMNRTGVAHAAISDRASCVMPCDRSGLGRGRCGRLHGTGRGVDPASGPPHSAARPGPRGGGARAGTRKGERGSTASPARSRLGHSWRPGQDPRASCARRCESCAFSIGSFGGAPGRTRTCDPLLRRQPLYPPELPERTPNLAPAGIDRLDAEARLTPRCAADRLRSLRWA